MRVVVDSKRVNHWLNSILITLCVNGNHFRNELSL
ncbi:Uncharacterised protein [Serratia fonticola]|uniref:Uncharacterized protein n=1 Tax=Serratia fonticola TaxID=47917 RepID=A0A3S4XN22_SERFO|nr:Uncharacterised protein [Serratia fonticola]CAI1105837.1 Uncharacterised protein [Serratia fonticola]CAI1111104.1 Uncharacterised protein [Serratia fonticola]CAI1155179.1 Uncharacterised protein [Serratia fonticola]CAI1744341.1 Uncharacterised protein [Serratia fonticola]